MNQIPQQAPAGLIRRLLRKMMIAAAGILPKKAHAWQLNLHGRPFIVWINETIGRRLVFARRFEDDDIACFQSFLRPGDAVLDVGGNIGLHAVAFATSVGATGVVHSFEPFRRNALLIALNAELNGLENIHVHETVVSDRSGIDMSATIPLDDTAFAYFSAQGGASGNSRTVATTTLDTFVSAMRIAAVAGLKIDVEGAEYNVLSGATSLFSDPDTRPRFAMIEVASGHLNRFGHTFRDIFSFFASRGYDAFVLKSGALRMVEESEVPDCVNVFFRLRPDDNRR